MGLAEIALFSALQFASYFTKSRSSNTVNLQVAVAFVEYIGCVCVCVYVCFVMELDAELNLSVRSLLHECWRKSLPPQEWVNKTLRVTGVI